MAKNTCDESQTAVKKLVSIHRGDIFIHNLQRIVQG